MAQSPHLSCSFGQPQTDLFLALAPGLLVLAHLLWKTCCQESRTLETSASSWSQARPGRSIRFNLFCSQQRGGTKGRKPKYPAWGPSSHSPDHYTVWRRLSTVIPRGPDSCPSAQDGGCQAEPDFHPH